jgi:hypothetical protein
MATTDDYDEDDARGPGFRDAEFDDPDTLEDDDDLDEDDRDDKDDEDDE